jgi:TolB-like protein/Tfp pilus assembly protein PilF
VLPFVNMSDDKGNEYFSDGLSEELLNLLAKIPQLRVIARTSSFAYKGTTTKIADVARELNVAHVLEGSVRKSGNQVRITAQLIRASDSSHLWSETYDRSLDDVFAIQDEISAAVVEQLKITLLGAAPKAKEANPAAYVLYLQARQVQRQGTAEGFAQSIALFQQALAIAPDYAAAWAGLAESYSRQADKGLRPSAEAYTLAREAADKALAIDPDSAAAHTQLGWIAMNYDGDLSAAARHMERALQLDPANLDIFLNAADLTGNLGRMDEAVALGEYVVSRDPVNALGQYRLGINYLWARRPDEAMASLRTALSLSPGRIGAQSAIGDALLLQGKPDAALAAIQQEAAADWRLMGLAMAYHALGRTAESDAALAEAIDKYEKGSSYNIAYVLAYRGEADRAFEWLNKAVQYKDSGLSQIPTQIEFTNIQNDPRWLPFLESIGKSPAQLDAIKFKVTLPK